MEGIEVNGPLSLASADYLGAVATVGNVRIVVGAKASVYWVQTWNDAGFWQNAAKYRTRAGLEALTGEAVAPVRGSRSKSAPAGRGGDRRTQARPLERIRSLCDLGEFKRAVQRLPQRPADAVPGWSKRVKAFETARDARRVHLDAYARVIASHSDERLVVSPDAETYEYQVATLWAQLGRADDSWHSVVSARRLCRVRDGVRLRWPLEIPGETVGGAWFAPVPLKARAQYVGILALSMAGLPDYAADGSWPKLPDFPEKPA